MMHMAPVEMWEVYVLGYILAPVELMIDLVLATDSMELVQHPLSTALQPTTVAKVG